MSLYAEYLKEKTGDEILETEKGFASYRYLDDGKTVYLVDIYVKPEFRRDNEAKEMADAICKDAKERGATKLLGTVIPSNRGSTTSLYVLLGYGMTLDSATNDMIIFRKAL